MKKYRVEIEETLSKSIEVEAESSSSAYTSVLNKYKNSDIVLSSEDFLSYEINVLEEL